MSKGKLQKFADMEALPNVFQFPYSWFLSNQRVGDSADSLPKGGQEFVSHPLSGTWHSEVFHNQNPIVLELGCGKGEYTVGLAKMFPEMNFIGVDIKGSRMWTGAMQAHREGMENVAFLRTNIEIIDRFFREDEVQEIWLTFSDPQMKNPRKRLTSTYFLERYRHFLCDRGVIHLKTDSRFLYTYTRIMAETNHLPILVDTDNLYANVGEAVPHSSKDISHLSAFNSQLLTIQTYYEQMWIARGLNIKYLKFLLPREGELTEPDVEIELDDYRSYHRDKRSPKTTAK